MPRMTIQVKQAHIDQGVIGNEFECPVALALKEVFHNVVEAYNLEVSVAQCDIMFYASLDNTPANWRANHVSRAAPREVANFIRRYDYGSPVEPFEFEFDAPIELEVS